MEEKIKKAVALKYERGKDGAPKVTAKGRGIVAEKIVEIARESGIPILEDKNLVEFLISLDLGEEIPPELYKVVAEILAYVYKISRRESPSR
ncbi:MAG: flagellar biosynthesis protein FlhB [Thermovibrio sp.]|nr:MAG: flagellar biosynthesis protein FlhB [Thermovibrio sp.]